MMDYVRTALTGWAAFLLFVASLLLPYLIRRTRSHGVPFLKQLWPHYWIGYGLPVIAFIHAWIPMRTGNLRGINMTGLWLATIALMLLAVQLFIGLQLQSPTQSNRKRLRAAHFWTMALLAGLIVIHVVLNRP